MNNINNFLFQPLNNINPYYLTIPIRETKIRLHHWAQIDFVIKVREFTKLRHMMIQNKNKNIFGTFCDEVSRPLGYLWCQK